jgi:hypothetical protein
MECEVEVGAQFVGCGGAAAASIALSLALSCVAMTAVCTDTTVGLSHSSYARGGGRQGGPDIRKFLIRET